MSRLIGMIAAAVGALLLIGSLVWSAAAVPQLVRFPLTTNVTLHYSGSLVTYVDARTGATLATPSSAPLAIERSMRALPSESTSSTAVVAEHVVTRSGSTTDVQNNRYAIDRRNMDEVASPRAFSFSARYPGASPGSYYVNLPMDLKAGTTTLRIWKPETGTTYPLVPLKGGAQPASLYGLRVDWFSGVLPMTPVTDYERAALRAEGLPMSIPPSRVEAKLTASGVSVSKLSAALLPVLTPLETKQVLTVLSTPVSLRYYSFGSGLVAAEPRTGAIVALKNVVDGIAAAPATNGIDTLLTVLSHHRSVAGVPAAMASLRRLAAAAPAPVYELRYTQTPASVAGMVRTTNQQISRIELAKLWIPTGLAALGAVLFIGGGAVIVRRRTPRATKSGVSRSPVRPRSGPTAETEPAA